MIICTKDHEDEQNEEEDNEDVELGEASTMKHHEVSNR
jgi:hypothetical protein